MTNPIQPVVELAFDERMFASLPLAVQKALGTTTLEIEFDFESIARAEQEMKRPLLMGLTQEEVSRPTIAFVRSMLYHGLRVNHEAITCDEASALVTAKTITPIWSAVLTAFVNAIRDDDEEDLPDPTTGQV